MPAFVSGVVFIIDTCGHTNLDIPIVRMPHINFGFCDRFRAGFEYTLNPRRRALAK
jgi:hypothetical protein